MQLSFEFILSAFSGVLLVSALMFYITSTVPRVCPGHHAWMMSATSASLGVILLLIISIQDHQETAFLIFKLGIIGWAMGMYRGLMRFLYVPQNLQQLLSVTALALLLIAYFEQFASNLLLSDIVFSAYCSGLMILLAINIFKTKPACCHRILNTLAVLLVITGLYILSFHFSRSMPVFALFGFLLALSLIMTINMLLISLTIHQLLNQLEASEAAALDSAARDPLTNLLNRNGLEESFKEKLSGIDDEEQSLVLMFIDLDGFKNINDSYGHQAGDVVLKTIAKRLQSHTNNVKDMIARFGGDEFVIILQFNSATVRPHILRQIANRLLKSMHQTITDGKKHYRVSGSIGISHYPQNANSLDELLNQADKAMYQAKQSGANTFRLWSENQIYLRRPEKQAA